MSDFVKELLKEAKKYRDEAKLLERIAARHQEKPMIRRTRRKRKKSKTN